jgi:hypothetical protein
MKQRQHSPARAPGLGHHSLLTGRQPIGVLLKETEVSTDDGAWRPQFVGYEAQRTDV